MIDLLKRLMLVQGVSGREDKVTELIKNEVAPYADEITVDNMGNLIVRKKGNGKKIMYCAHMDEIGFLATYIDDKGLIKVSPIGAINAPSAAYSHVVSENGVNGVLVPEDKNDVKVENMYIDIGAKTKKQAEAKVKIGDSFVLVPVLKKLLGQRYVGRPIDNRIGCAILIEALKRIDKCENDLYFVFSVQEEVGGRGSRPAAYAINADIGFAVDITGTGDKPGSPTLAVEMSKGCAIKIKDTSVISSPTLVNEMRDIAEKHGIKYQNEILPYGGTDAPSIQVARGGARVSAISVPTAFFHTGCEMIDMSDVKEAVKLIVELSREL